LLTFSLQTGTIHLGDADTMKLEYNVMGKRIADRRTHLKIKQNDLAERIGVSNNHLSSIERGKEKPSLDVLISICNELRVTPDYLLMGTMHSSSVPQNIVDGLQLCTDEDIALVSAIIDCMVKRQGRKWNDDNYI
jgi:transcriptional regulator with XRE-family HTH domain